MNRKQSITLGVMILLAVLPPVFYWSGNAFYLDLATRLVILATAAVSLNLILGYGGMVSFGHAAYVGLGAYAVGIPAHHWLYGGLESLGLATTSGLVQIPLAVAVTALAFPECRAGPYSALSAELSQRWLSQIHEARGIVDFASRFGAANYALLVYIALLLAAGVALVRHQLASRHLVPVLAVLAICLVLSFLQVRALRLGVFAAVPVCVILADLAWRHFSAARGRSRAVVMLMTGLSALVLISPVWLVTANAVLPPPGSRTAAVADAPEWSRQEGVASICNRDTDFSFLATLPAGLVLNDLNTGPAILVFTGHSVVAGNYHRNGRAILDTMDFFAADEAAARAIIERRKPQYIAYCLPLPAAQPESASKKGSIRDSIGRRILDGREPAWLQRISPADDRLKVYRITDGG